MNEGAQRVTYQPHGLPARKLVVVLDDFGQKHGEELWIGGRRLDVAGVRGEPVLLHVRSIKRRVRV